MKKILILYVDAGGGHLASAKAIAKAIKYRYEDGITVQLIDALKEMPFRPAQEADEIYQWLTGDYGIWIWKALWKTDEKVWLPKALSRVIRPLMSPTVTQILRDEKPDLIVSVHYAFNHVLMKILREDLKANIPFVTVVTDMVTAHPIWFSPDVDYCMVPTEPARERALRYGMPPERVEVVGQPVDPDYADNIGDKQEVREKLSLDLDRPCILIMGGGDGMGPIERIAHAISANVSNAQMIVVTGRNAKLKQQLEDQAWEIPTKIFGFADNVPELMSASDLLVTKAGPGTIAEAFIAGLPIIISSYIPGQERGNLDYVLEHGAGLYLTDPLDIAYAIRNWLAAETNGLKELTENARRIARPQASFLIADRLNQFLHEGVDNRLREVVG